MVGTLVRVVDALRELPIGEVAGGFIGRLTGIGTIGGGAFGAVDVEVVVDVDDQLCTPWWPRQAPRREVPLQEVPSLQIALALPVVAEVCVGMGAGVIGLRGAVAVAVVVVVVVVADADDQLCTPW